MQYIFPALILAIARQVDQKVHLMFGYMKSAVSHQIHFKNVMIVWLGRVCVRVHVCVCVCVRFLPLFFLSSYKMSLLIHYIYGPAICCSQSTCSRKIGENFLLESAVIIFGESLYCALNLYHF